MPAKTKGQKLKVWDVTTCILDVTDPANPSFVWFEIGGESYPTRVERIDTNENVLFKSKQTPWDVADMVEAYWNRLNDSDEDNVGNAHSPSQRVVVTQVMEVK